MKAKHSFKIAVVICITVVVAIIIMGIRGNKPSIVFEEFNSQSQYYQQRISQYSGELMTIEIIDTDSAIVAADIAFEHFFGGESIKKETHIKKICYDKKNDVWMIVRTRNISIWESLAFWFADAYARTPTVIIGSNGMVLAAFA